MTRPIYEPTPGRTDRALGFSSDQLFRRPAPRTRGVCSEWIALQNGGTTIPTDTNFPVPFAELVYDPGVTTVGSSPATFDWDITDTGDPGNDRFELITRPEAWYEYNLRTGWDQVATNGTEPFAFFRHSLDIKNISLTTSYYTNYASADWLRDDVDGGTSNNPGEQIGNQGFLNLSDVVYLAGNRIWKIEALQTTGVDRGLSGIELHVRMLCPTDSSEWVTELV